MKLCELKGLLQSFRRMMMRHIAEGQVFMTSYCHGSMG